MHVCFKKAENACIEYVHATLRCFRHAQDKRNGYQYTNNIIKNCLIAKFFTYSFQF